MSPTPNLKEAATTYNRRAHLRFPIYTKMTYAVGRLHGEGVTCNISTGGFFIKTDQSIPLGSWIHLLIDWPAKLNKNRRLNIAVEGTIVRCTVEGTAVKISEYEYQVSLIQEKPIFHQAS